MAKNLTLSKKTVDLLAALPTDVVGECTKAIVYIANNFEGLAREAEASMSETAKIYMPFFKSELEKQLSISAKRAVAGRHAKPALRKSK